MRTKNAHFVHGICTFRCGKGRPDFRDFGSRFGEDQKVCISLMGVAIFRCCKGRPDFRDFGSRVGENQKVCISLMDVAIVNV